MEISQILKPLLKWWWLILAATVVAAASSYLAVSQQPPTYWAGTTLMIGRGIEDPNPTGADIYLSQQLGSTYVDMAGRQPVREQTMAALGIEFLPSYNVRQIPNSQLLEISVIDYVPARAQAVANELANQLILQSPTAPKPEEQERDSFINEQLANLQVKIEDTDEEIIARQNALEDAISAREIADLQGEIQALQEKQSTLQANYAALLLNTSRGAVNTLTVIEPATLPLAPFGPEKGRAVLIAAALGLALAVGAAFLLEYLDDTIKSSADLKRVSDLPILPAIPDYSASNHGNNLITYHEPRSPAADAFRALRTSILVTFSDNHRRVLLVTSVKPGDGKSNVASNLAVTMAQGGHDILLVDADLHRPVQNEIFELNSEPGLTELLVAFGPANQDSEITDLLQQAIQPTIERRLSFLASGSMLPETLKFMNSETTAKVLDAVSYQFDYVIIDSPPVLAVSDALMLGTQVDDVLVVAEAGSVRRKELVESLDRLDSVGVHVVGLVLNRISPRSDGYYHRYRDYYVQTPDLEVSVGAATQNQGRRGSGRKWLRKRSARPPVQDKGYQTQDKINP